MKTRFCKLCLIAALGLLSALPVRAASRFIILCYHEVVQNAPVADPFAVDTRGLVNQFEWLRSRGYTFVSMDDIVADREGRRPLPDKAVMLSFDDGYRSVYQHVFPILKLYKAPAVVALVGSWLEAAAGSKIEYEGTGFTRESFLLPREIKEMQASGLIEFANHSYAMHKGLPANPQGNLEPAATSYLYDSGQGRYEDEAAHRQRASRDLERNSAAIAKLTGKKPRIMVWPYGSYTRPLVEIASRQGMPITLTLGDGINQPATPLTELRRVLIDASMTLTDFTNEIIVREREPAGIPPAYTRAMHVDLDQIYDPDPVRQEAKLGQMLDRVLEMGVNTVYLRAFSDGNGDSEADALYFPNRLLPVKADLFNRAAWQLKTRAMVQVYAARPLSTYATPGQSAPTEEGGVRQTIRAIVEDLSRTSRFAGLLLIDDPARPGLAEPGAHDLLNFADELSAIARTYQPELRSAITVYAGKPGDQGDATRFSDTLAKALPHFDYVEVMTTPGVAVASRGLKDVLATAKTHSSRLQQIVFGLPSRNPATGQPIPSKELTQAVTELHTQGARHIAYAPDDIFNDQPRLATMKRVFSLRSQPER
ncbi:poly-beta-1,6-N-acetyl-D-glucosamine N-deacetylase PgaB [Crenobacter cavernae]|uniref:Poly-beta-1,6-N-acetyl-D-glucosamine N-deacetylase PgaB n=1 Tax=Crenobacter cavernae TaxID=2290923 RepID=A0A345Y8F0_9NEIS|nr:poly-beta-1,6-N-acetyl-D-glucosamine N-deacetylase PgaB [Crenobacter cavernae]AXK40202.1 poly-beta-1,6-N-acetyl-D-glucosamine N-deacetylase PgaB [Crenobacter cavernae]